MRAFVLVALLSLTVLAGCTSSPGPGPAGSSAGTSASTGPSASCSQAPDLPVPSAPIAVLATTAGTLKVALEAEKAPHTVATFVCLAKSGFYDGTRFHRIIKDFMMQGGDPNSKDNDPGNDGTGGPGFTTQDEFHYKLRHNAPGVISMANSGPNTQGSQFFITFVATPHLDDRHTVFGHVTEGMEILDKVNAEFAGGNDGKPKAPVTLTKVTIESGATPPATSGLSLWIPDADHKVPQSGGTTRYLAVVESSSNQRCTVELTVGNGTVDPSHLTLAAGQRATVVVTVNATSAAGSTLRAAAGADVATATLKATPSADVGPRRVALGDSVKANYIGLTSDGRVFDTSVQAVGQYAVAHQQGYQGFAGKPTYNTFTFQPGGGVIKGFTEMAIGLEEGGKNAAALPPEKAYGTQPCGTAATCLSGRTLFFQLEAVDIV